MTGTVTVNVTANVKEIGIAEDAVQENVNLLGEDQKTETETEIIDDSHDHDPGQNLLLVWRNLRLDQLQHPKLYLMLTLLGKPLKNKKC